MIELVLQCQTPISVSVSMCSLFCKLIEIQFRLVIHSPLPHFSRNSSCSYSCDRIKQSQFLVLRLSLEFDNRFNIYCDTTQLFSAHKIFIMGTHQKKKEKQIIEENSQATKVLPKSI